MSNDQCLMAKLLPHHLNPQVLTPNPNVKLINLPVQLLDQTKIAEVKDLDYLTYKLMLLL
jgi:hypothetical protein